MNFRNTKSFLSTMAVLGVLSYVGSSPVTYAAEENPSNPQIGILFKEHTKKVFKLGVCVGQTLADQGLMLPRPSEPGAKPKLDHETKLAIKKAIRECKKELWGSQDTSSPTEEEEELE